MICFQRILIIVLLVHLVVLANTNQDTANDTTRSQSLLLSPKSSLSDSLKPRPSSIEAFPKEYRKQTPIGGKIQFLAQTISGVAIAGIGVVYWMHFSEANNFAQKNGITTMYLPIIVTLTIPIGGAIAAFSAENFATSFFKDIED